ncbi:protein of unknown function [Burkholderia multivorans]
MTKRPGRASVFGLEVPKKCSLQQYGNRCGNDAHEYADVVAEMSFDDRRDRRENQKDDEYPYGGSQLVFHGDTGH